MLLSAPRATFRTPESPFPRYSTYGERSQRIRLRALPVVPPGHVGIATVRWNGPMWPGNRPREHPRARRARARGTQSESVQRKGPGAQRTGPTGLATYLGTGAAREEPTREEPTRGGQTRTEPGRRTPATARRPGRAGGAHAGGAHAGGQTRTEPGRRTPAHEPRVGRAGGPGGRPPGKALRAPAKLANGQ